MEIRNEEAKDVFGNSEGARSLKRGSLGERQELKQKGKLKSDGANPGKQHKVV